MLLLQKTETRRSGHNRYEVTPHLHMVSMRDIHPHILEAYYRVSHS